MFNMMKNAMNCPNISNFPSADAIEVKLVSILKLSIQKHIFPFTFVFILNVGR